MLDFNLSANAASVEEYCTYWDSEHGRAGEDYTLLPSLYMNSITGGVSSAVTDGSVGGYDSWVRAGRPAEPTTTGADSSACEAPHYLKDDADNIRSVLAAESTVNGSSSITAVDTTHPTHTTNTSTTTATATSVEEQNVLAADYFLQQMLSSEHEADNIAMETETLDEPASTDGTGETSDNANTTAIEEESEMVH